MASTLSTATSSSTPSPSPRPPNYAALGLLIIPALTVFGNVLVILSVVRVQALHLRINYMIFMLAIADLLVAVAVMPFAVYVEMNHGVWLLGSLVCDIYIATDVACSTASIYLLAVISYDRFQAATEPLRYSQQRKSMQPVLIACGATWLGSAVIASPMFLGINEADRDADPHECRFHNGKFILISSMFSFFIPTCLILGLYLKIWHVIRKRQRIHKERRARAEQTMLANSVFPAAHLGLPVPKIDRAHELSAVSLTDTSGPMPLSSVHSEISRPSLVSSASFNGPIGLQLHYIDSADVLPEELISPSLPTGMSATLSVTLDLELSEDETQNSSVRHHTYDALWARRSYDTTEEIPALIEPLSSQFVIDDENNIVLPSRDSTRRPVPSVMVSNAPESPDTSRVCRMKQSESEFSITSNSHSLQVPAQPMPLWLQLLRMNSAHIINETARIAVVPDECRKPSRTVALAKSASVFFRKHMSVARGVSSVNVRRRVAHAHRKERRATKTLAVVLAVFLVCWLPFFLTNALNAVCLMLNVSECQIPIKAFFFTTWLGYINSFMNPIIYTLFSTDFRKAFRKLLCCPEHEAKV